MIAGLLYRVFTGPENPGSRGQNFMCHNEVLNTLGWRGDVNSRPLVTWAIVCSFPVSLNLCPCGSMIPEIYSTKLFCVPTSSMHQVQRGPGVNEASHCHQTSQSNEGDSHRNKSSQQHGGKHEKNPKESGIQITKGLGGQVVVVPEGQVLAGPGSTGSCRPF